MQNVNKKLIIDIETIGEDFDQMDEITQKALTRWIKQNSNDEDDYQKQLDDLKNGLGFSPLTGEIVAIGILDYYANEGAVYYQAPKASAGEIKEGNYKLIPMTETQMLREFWRIVTHYQEFITFNGRGFDIPFILGRSLVNKIKPTKDLMSNRYLSMQKFNAKHIDLLDLLSYYGAVWKKGNLHMWCRALGIKSPKADGVDGDDVGGLFKEGRFEDIARYNIRDLIATKELYKYWDEYLNF